MRVLHVATHLAVPGGHTRAIQRWIEADGQRQHSVAVTHQLDPIDWSFEAAVRARGGDVVLIDAFANLLGIAGRLREMARRFDLVVLSTDPSDVVPMLAFAGDPDRPPIALFNHADHVFWLGESITDLLVGFRQSGNRLAMARRGFGDERIALLPLPLRPADRSDLPDKAEARRRLGLPEAGRVTLSIASPYKFRATSKADYMALHAPLLDHDPDLWMVLVGPVPGSLPLDAISPEARGRVRAVGVQMDLSHYHAAADVYLDSTPFASQTSLLEAAALGLPCLSWRPYPADRLSSVLGSDDPAYSGLGITFNDPAAYREALVRLLNDPAARAKAGADLADAVSRAHWGPEWSATLSDVYARTEANARRRPHAALPDEGPSDVDVEINEFQSGWRKWTEDAQRRRLPDLSLRDKIEAVRSWTGQRPPSPRDFVPHYLVRMARGAKARIADLMSREGRR